VLGVVAALLAIVAGTFAFAGSAGAATPVTVQVVSVRNDVSLGLSIGLYDPVNGYSDAYPLEVKRADGTTGAVYCVQSDVDVVANVDYADAAWRDIANLDKVAWILAHSVPAITPEALTAAVDAATGTTITPYDVYEAQGITQLAIWHLTDGFDFDNVRTAQRTQYNLGNTGSDIDLDRLRVLYDYLTGPANTGSPAPSASVSFDGSAAHRVGERYGPITVTTSGTHVPVVFEGPKGTRVVDASGATVTTVEDQQQLYVHIPADEPAGSARLADTNPGAVLPQADLLFAVGRTAQALIVAKPIAGPATDALTIRWTASATTSPASSSSASSSSVPASPTAPRSSGAAPLANTGSQTQPQLGLALALIVAGGLVLMLARSRRAGRHRA
jgi:TQXA domain-containing protein